MADEIIDDKNKLDKKKIIIISAILLALIIFAVLFTYLLKPKEVPKPVVNVTVEKPVVIPPTPPVPPLPPVIEKPSQITPVCGNNVLEQNEECDGTNLNGIICESKLGSDWFGSVTCNKVTCKIDFSACELKKVPVPPPAPPEVPTVVVNISGFSFIQPEVKIKSGTKVMWNNKDNTQHTVTSIGTSLVLNSPALNLGENYSFVFNQTGVFDYQCNFHNTMKGKIIVCDPTCTSACGGESNGCGGICPFKPKASCTTSINTTGVCINLTGFINCSIVANAGAVNISNQVKWKDGVKFK